MTFAPPISVQRICHFFQNTSTAVLRAETKLFREGRIRVRLKLLLLLNLVSFLQEKTRITKSLQDKFYSSQLQLEVRIIACER